MRGEGYLLKFCFKRDSDHSGSTIITMEGRRLETGCEYSSKGKCPIRRENKQREKHLRCSFRSKDAFFKKRQQYSSTEHERV